jgi:hypothetical protein
MIDLELLLQDIAALTPFSVALVAFAGRVVGIAPSSFPLISVAAGLAAGQGAAESGKRRITGLWLAAGFVLGIPTVDSIRREDDQGPGYCPKPRSKSSRRQSTMFISIPHDQR